LQQTPGGSPASIRFYGVCAVDITRKTRSIMRFWRM
jgi:hypothetical protein